MTNHLESFRKRYAFHLRNWQLDGKGIFSHQKDIKEKQSAVIHIVLQPTGASERVSDIQRPGKGPVIIGRSDNTLNDNSVAHNG